jgi:hypothetical protein
MLEQVLHSLPTGVFLVDPFPQFRVLALDFLDALLALAAHWLEW